MLHSSSDCSLGVEVLSAHLSDIFPQALAFWVSEILLNLVEQLVLVLPGKLQKFVHFLTVSLGPLEGGVFLLDALFESDEVGQPHHLPADIVELLPASQEEGEDRVEICAGDHFDAFLLVVGVVEHLLQNTVEPAVVKVRILLGL